MACEDFRDQIHDPAICHHPRNFPGENAMVDGRKITLQITLAPVGMTAGDIFPEVLVGFGHASQIAEFLFRDTCLLKYGLECSGGHVSRMHR